MILGNYTALNSNPGRAIGNFTNLYSNYKPGGWYSFYDPDIQSHKTRDNSRASFPTGTQPHYSWIVAPKGGELTSTTQINGDSDMSASMANGINIVSSLAGTGTISSGALSLVTSMIATIACTGTLTGSMVGTIQMAASLAGSGDITGSLNMLSGMVANLAGTGAISADLKGKLFMAADIYVNQSEATVQQIVDAVWNALAAEYDLSGTMGEKLNGAGSAGDPWTTDLTGYNTADTAGKILKERLSKNQFLGLK